MVEVDKRKYEKANSSGFILVLFILGFLLVFKKRKKHLIIVSSIFVISIINISCKKEIIEAQFSNVSHSITLENLENNTKYYWKIKPNESQQIHAESIVYDFYIY